MSDCRGSLKATGLAALFCLGLAVPGGARPRAGEPSPRLKAWAVATIRHELGFRMAELEAVGAALGRLEGRADAGDSAVRRKVAALRRRLLEGYWSVNRLKRELWLIAPEEFAREGEEPAASLAPELEPLLDPGGDLE